MKAFKNTLMDMDYLTTLAAKVATGNWFLKTFAGVMTTAVGFLLPIRDFLILIGCLVTADFITGIMAARTKREPIASAKLSRTVSKLIAYGIAILVARGVRVVFVPHIEVAYFVAAFVAITEVQSVYENIGTITGTDIWTALKDKFKLKK